MDNQEKSELVQFRTLEKEFGVKEQKAIIWLNINQAIKDLLNIESLYREWTYRVLNRLGTKQDQEKALQQQQACQDMKNDIELKIKILRDILNDIEEGKFVI